MVLIDMEMPTACTKGTYTKDGYVYEHCKFFENCNKAVLLRNNFKPVDCPLKEVTNNEAEKTLEHIQRIVDDYSYDKAKGWWNIQQALRQYGEYKKYKEQKGENT